MLLLVILFSISQVNIFKVLLCLFTCTAVCAASLESVEDLPEEHFLEGLSRLIAQRGKPGKIMLDNATYFNASKDTTDMACKDITDP